MRIPGLGTWNQTATPSGAAPNESQEVDRCTLLEQHAFSLRFKSPALESAYLREVAHSRLPVLVAIASFDLCMFMLRMALTTSVDAGSVAAIPRTTAIAQLRNLAALYSLIAAIHWRSMKSGVSAGQGELLLSFLLSGMLSILVRAVGTSSSWVYVAFFLICTSQVVRLRWLIGAAAMGVPVLLCAQKNLQFAWVSTPSAIGASGGLLSSLRVTSSQNGAMGLETMFQLAAAWAVGTLMGFLSDSSRRQAFSNHRRALAAAAIELTEVRARVAAEHQLAAAQAVAEARSALADREKASNEAKSEFISMLCHEIRTPLNGCLASAEMLLQTDLNDDQKELADTVRVSGSILLSTVSNFLDFFKLEAGKPLDIVRTPLDLPSLVGDVHRIIDAMIGSDNADVVLLPPDLTGAPGMVLGDPSRLCGVLLNLYTNAAKFTRRGSVGIKVHVVSADYRPGPPMVEEEEGGGPSLTSSRSVATSFSRSQSRSGDGSGDGSGGDGSGSNSDGDGGDMDTVGPISSSPVPREAMPSGPVPLSALTARNLGYSSSEHDSVTSMRPGRRGGAAGWKQQAVVRAPRSPGTMKMLVQEEGDGWLSTASESKPRNSISSNNVAFADQEELWVCFEVRDTGGGVPPKSLHALFHNYVQGDASDMEQPRTRSGTGLGLAICGKQVSVLDGTIGAVSKPNCGSIFWFKVPMLACTEENPTPMMINASPVRSALTQLPQQRASVDTTNDIMDDPTAASTPQFNPNLENRWQAASTPATDPSADASGKAASPLTGLKVLVAEDNLINRKVACRVLQSLGASYEVASNGREAVEVVLAARNNGTRLDAILMDMCMPEMNGVEATRAIRGAGITTPIVAMTANAMDRDRDECLAAGMDSFLSKPVLREQLVNCLAAACLPAGPGGLGPDASA